MYPIQNLIKKFLCLFFTFVFSFVLTFSHNIVYTSIENDLDTAGFKIVTSQSTESCFDFAEYDDNICEKLEKTAEHFPIERDVDDAPEHLNTILFTDFLSYHTYSLKIHLTEITNTVFAFNKSIHSDSFILDPLRPPIFA